MGLLKEDEKYLSERHHEWAYTEDPAGGGYLVIHALDVSEGGFVPSKTDLMIRIPAQYNMASLDMWYCDPPIRQVQTGQFAPASEVTESHLGRIWQRFSRHLEPGKWRPGLDNLRSFMTLIKRELCGGKG